MLCKGDSFGSRKRHKRLIGRKRKMFVKQLSEREIDFKLIIDLARHSLQKIPSSWRSLYLRESVDVFRFKIWSIRRPLKQKENLRTISFLAPIVDFREAAKRPLWNLIYGRNRENECLKRYRNSSVWLHHKELKSKEKTRQKQTHCRRQDRSFISYP